MQTLLYVCPEAIITGSLISCRDIGHRSSSGKTSIRPDSLLLQEISKQWKNKVENPENQAEPPTTIMRAAAPPDDSPSPPPPPAADGDSNSSKKWVIVGIVVGVVVLLLVCAALFFFCFFLRR